MTLPLSVDMICREKMATWCHQIVHCFQFQPEIVEISLNYLDRYLVLDETSRNDRSNYQLASMTALYLAVKIHETQAIDPQMICFLSNGNFGRQDLKMMELRILKVLDWRVNPPTATSFVCLMSSGLDSEVHQLTRRQIDAVAASYEFVSVPAYTIAYAALLNAMECLGMKMKAEWPAPKGVRVIQQVLKPIVQTLPNPRRRDSPVTVAGS